VSEDDLHPLTRRLTGTTFLWVYVAVVATIGVVLTILQPGGPF
jgi:hypothetical protein